MIPAQYAYFPALIAGLNGTSAALLVAGRYMIARGRMAAHRASMIAAMVASGLFLICYVYFHAHLGNIRFLGQGVWRLGYFRDFVASCHLSHCDRPHGHPYVEPGIAGSL